MGRGSFEIKTCASPGRDRTTDEKRLLKQESLIKPKTPRTEGIINEENSKQIRQKETESNSFINSHQIV